MASTVTSRFSAKIRRTSAVAIMVTISAGFPAKKLTLLSISCAEESSTRRCASSHPAQITAQIATNPSSTLSTPPP